MNDMEKLQDERHQNVLDAIKKLEEKIELGLLDIQKNFVHKSTFRPVQLIAFGAVGTILYSFLQSTIVSVAQAAMEIF